MSAHYCVHGQITSPSMSKSSRRVSVADIAASALRNRHLARAPLWLYEHGLGRLLGDRFVMLEHQGRTTGHTRRVCLEIIARPTSDSLVVASGFGTASQWYQNLRAQPACDLTVGAHRHAATAEFLSPAQSQRTLTEYQRRHPRAWKQLRAVLESTLGGPIEDLPMVQFRFTHP